MQTARESTGKPGDDTGWEGNAGALVRVSTVLCNYGKKDAECFLGKCFLGSAIPRLLAFVCSKHT